MPATGDSDLNIVGDSNSEQSALSGEQHGLNVHDAYGDAQPGLLGKIWNHVSDNFKTVISGQGTFLQDLEVVGEAAVASGVVLGAAGAGVAALLGGGATEFTIWTGVWGAGGAMLGGAEATGEIKHVTDEAAKHKCAD